MRSKRIVTARERPGLIRERLKRHLSQQDLAEKLGTTFVTVSRWEHGHVQPSAYYRQRLCEIFEKTPAEIYALLTVVEVNTLTDEQKTGVDPSLLPNAPLGGDVDAINRDGQDRTEVSVPTYDPPSAVSANQKHEPPGKQPRSKYTPRQRLLNKVEKFWVRGVLENAVPENVFMEPDFHFLSDALSQPWDDVFHTKPSSSLKISNGLQMLRLYDELGGKLLILGDPGSGKTILLLELARALLERAQEDEAHPIPVVFQLSSWTQKQRSLGEWLQEELTSKYQVPHLLSQRWVEQDMLLPLLDGFDEIVARDRYSCLEAINRYRREGRISAWVICSRRSEYQQLEAKLHIRGAIDLCPLTVEQIRDYLTRRGTVMSPLREALEQAPDFMELAKNPFMLNILTFTYSDVAQEKQSILLAEKHDLIFAAYVQRALQRQKFQNPFTIDQTLQWLHWLASQMKSHSQSIYYIEYMQADWLPDERSQKWYRLLGERLPLIVIGMLLCLSMGKALGASEAHDGILVEACIYMLPGALLGWIFGRKSEGLLGSARKWRKLAFFQVEKVPPYLINSLFVGGVSECIIPILRRFIPFLDDRTSLLALVCGIAAGILTVVRHNSTIIPAEIVSWSWPACRENMLSVKHLLNSLLVGFSIDLFFLFRMNLLNSRWELLVLNFLVGVAYWIGINAFKGIKNDIIPEAKHVRPNDGMRQSFFNSAMVTGMAFLFIGSLYFFLNMALYELYYRALSADVSLISLFWRSFLIGIPAGLIFGLLHGGIACIRHISLRYLLWRSKAFMWDSPTFLDQMAKCLLLRKVGGGYLFVHRMLLDYFADLDRTNV
ncbi:NACHT domain-containing protein [Tengunoibacter tsumagoiensis]|uniref:HTH cro/C1-type domain-containing protein n=1 Tax=Tengunoibacter tsumagoiensis TaxID=2014871 RepID=A0A401ZZ49_9CHLR|nr:NACHT domain-containing protein [Tengunoibacter tsumagoiensis]GCE12103.1 hypothetical protein KTT_19620 [Tengunoibacter tsumagoiensis]